MCVILPAKHLRVVVDGDVGSDAAVVRAEVAVRCTEPFIKTMLQRKVLRSVAKVPEMKHIHTNQYTYTWLNITQLQYTNTQV